MKKLALFAAVAGAAAIFPTAAFASFTGVVVGKSPGALAIASKSGAIHTAHTHTRARVGARVRVSGTAVRVIGRAHNVRIHAVIVRRTGSTTLLAGGHSLFAMHSARRLASVLDTTQPTTGSVINTTAQVTPSGQLNAGQTTVVGQMSTIQVQALVTVVGPGSITVSVNGTPFTIALPAGIQLPASLVGQSVALTLSLAGGQPTANEDDNGQGDDNDDQGDDDHGGGGDGGGDD
jgi:hypothetical protein